MNFSVVQSAYFLQLSSNVEARSSCAKTYKFTEFTGKKSKLDREWNVRAMVQYSNNEEKHFKKNPRIMEILFDRQEKNTGRD